MSDKPLISSKKLLYKGYMELNLLDLEVPSLAEPQKKIKLTKKEILQTSDSVVILVYAPIIDSFIFCQQFREGVYCNHSGDEPFFLECIAGNIEQDENPETAAIRETYEETGLKIDKVQLFAHMYRSPGTMTEKSYMYYAKINTVPNSGIHGIEDEEIKTHVISKAEVYKLMDDMVIKDGATLLALNWFRARN